MEREAIEGLLFRDRQTRRTWYVRKLQIGSPNLDGVHITQQDEQGNITRKWYADRATWDARTSYWTLKRGKRVDFDADGNVAHESLFPDDHRTMTGWNETPERIASSNLDAQNLTVPELRAYLKFNADFSPTQLAPYRTLLEHRYALPWSCLVVVFIAAPLGIVFSRRGVLGGVASSIFIFFGMIFATNLFLALGKGGRVSPWLAAWAPIGFIGLIGVVLLYYRSTNRELPRFGFKRA
jgi:lipopolysaccharide export LptBFGC system permease protein LptF